MDRHTVAIAVHIFLRRDGQVFIIRRFNTGWADGNYVIPAGHVEKGESVLEAAVREAKEEAGVTINEGSLRFAHVIHQQKNVGDQLDRVHLFFECVTWVGEAKNSEPEKCDHAYWCDENNLPSNLQSYIRETLIKIKKGIMYSEFIDA